MENLFHDTTVEQNLQKLGRTFNIKNYERLELAKMNRNKAVILDGIVIVMLSVNVGN